MQLICGLFLSNIPGELQKYYLFSQRPNGGHILMPYIMTLFNVKKDSMTSGLVLSAPNP